MRVEVAGARVPGGGAASLVERAALLAGETGATIQLMDARLVCGREHLEVAAEKAVRAMAAGRMTARTLSSEILLYASGERQIGRAIEKMGVRDDTSEVGLVVAGDDDPEEILKALGLEREDDVLDIGPDKLTAYGVTREELASVEPEKAADLVLEKVALVDLLK